ncbi:YezD family protein [Alicyclobacillus cellulosilyticus]|nr:YezD family protein [Alicyclobacillus cellulosilyticus]
MREILYHVARAKQGLEYGTVQITVHDAQVTQIERIEKVRFPLQPGGKGGSKNAAKSRVFP